MNTEPKTSTDPHRSTVSITTTTPPPRKSRPRLATELIALYTLSLLTLSYPLLPSLAIAQQSTPADLNCFSYHSAIGLSNNCQHSVVDWGYYTDGSGNCRRSTVGNSDTDFFRESIPSSVGFGSEINAPARLCLHWKDAAKQAAAGYQSCRESKITDCGSGNAVVFENPPVSPPTGTINVTPASTLTIDEGASGTLSVSLSTAPNADVTVSLAKTNSDVSLSPTSLTFTSNNYSTAQTVTVTAAEDDADYVDDTDTITLTATGGIDASSVAKAVTITDNDTPTGTINVTPGGTLTIGEGASSTLSVSLSTAPNADVTVSLAKTNSDVTLSTSSLTFTSNNYSTAQTVTVTAAEDDADYVDDTDTITLSASGGITASNVTKAVTVTDNDTPSGMINITPAGTLTIDEGASGTLSVSLSTAPNANVTVSLAKTNTDVTLSVSTLTFTTGNYNTAQTVTVMAAEDSDTTDDSDTITLSASGGIIASNITKAVTVTDNDKPSGTINVTPAGTLTIGEGASGTLSVSLSTAPNANVTVSLAKTNSDVSLSPSSLTFTTSNYSTAQTVTVTAGEDNDTTDDSDTITLSASGGIIAPDITRSVTITDNDTPSGTINVTPAGTLTIGEGDSTGGTLSIALSAAPNANVTVSLAKTNTDVTLSPSSLTFTTSNYSTAQTVTVTAAEDNDTTDDSDTITLSASGGIIAPDITRSVTITDNDTGMDNNTATRQATQAWLSRFGRGVGEQAIQGIRQRINSRHDNQPAPLQTRLGGHSIDASQPLSSTAAGLLKQLDSNNLLHGSRFSASGKSGAGQIGIWGQGAYSDFAGEDNGVELDGKLRSLLLGSDYRRDNWAAGILLSRSNAEGDYRGEVITGELESDLTGVVPWGSIQMSEELSVWGAMGQGRGELQLKPVNESGIKTDLDWQMLAGGMQSRLIKAGERNRMGLSFTGDLLWTETTTDRVAMLQAVAGETRRVRLGLEADWRSRGGLTPRLELGIRHDSGDAETGLGVELGGGLTWRDGQGNRFEVNGRGLLTHNDSDSRDWGLSIVAQHDARPSSHRGFSMRLSHELGGSASGGLARLLSEDLLSADNTAADYRWELEMAYGMARARGLTGSGYTALSGGAGSGMGWRVGYRLQPEHTPAFEVDLHALDVRETDETDPGVGLNFIWR